MSIDIGPLFELVAQYGLPLVMFFGVIALSIRGTIVWPPTIRAYEERVRDVTEQRDKFAAIAYPAVKAVEEGARALQKAAEK